MQYIAIHLTRTINIQPPATTPEPTCRPAGKTTLEQQLDAAFQQSRTITNRVVTQDFR